MVVVVHIGCGSGYRYDAIHLPYCGWNCPFSHRTPCGKRQWMSNYVRAGSSPGGSVPGSAGSYGTEVMSIHKGKCLIIQTK